MDRSLIEIQAGFDEPMEDDLTWFARKVHEWPSAGLAMGLPSYFDDPRRKRVDFREDKAWIQPANVYVAREDWQQRRAELQNKPKFEDHPDAKCFVQNQNGTWCFNVKINNPTPNENSGWCSNERGWFLLYENKGEVLGDWQNTLEKRPESKPDQIPQPPQRLQYRPEDIAFNSMDQMCGPEVYHRINHPEQPHDMVGRKADSDKPRMDLIPPRAEKLMAEVLTFGAKKYSPENWRKVPNLTNRYTAAAMRHINDYRSGNSVDSETGIHHLAHAMCYLAFIIENDILSEVEHDAENNNPAPASQ